MKKNLTQTGKFISLVLRHKPVEIGLQLDANGWADVSELIEKLNAKGAGIDFELLNEIVETNNKKRFAFNDDKTRIRASQGHSIEVDVELQPATPPDVLYHGTAEKNLASIMASGLNKQQRLHVHLSAQYDTAINVGSRHGKPVVLKVDTTTMQNDGAVFYLSQNGVWLVDAVPVQYISKAD